jgi:hypothetical protein
VGAKFVRNITKVLKSATGVLFGRVTSGTGRGEELTPSQARSLLSVYTVTQTDTAISTAVNNLIGGSPGLLDTLDELAAALGDDANFASTVTTSLAGKQATLVSGTNIKTINSTSLLGSGDIAVSASPGGSSGQVQYNNAGAFGGATAVVYAGTGTHVVITSQAAATIPLCVKGAASQSGNLLEWRNSANSLRGAISAAGTLLLTQGDQYGCTLQNANFGPGNGLVFGGTAVFLLVNNNSVVGRLNTGGQLELTNSIILSDTTAPATAASTGTAGDVRFDANYMYRCVSTNTWKRVALSTW